MKPLKKFVSFWLSISSVMVTCMLMLGCQPQERVLRIRDLQHKLYDSFHIIPCFLSPIGDSAIVILQSDAVFLADRNISSVRKIADLPVFADALDHTGQAVGRDYLYCIGKESSVVMRCNIRTGQVDTIRCPSLSFCRLAEVDGDAYSTAVNSSDYIFGDRVLCKLDFDGHDAVVLKSFSKSDSYAGPWCTNVGGDLAVVIHNRVKYFGASPKDSLVLPKNERVDHMSQFPDGSKLLITHLTDSYERSGSIYISRIYRIPSASHELIQTFEFSHGKLSDVYSDGDCIVAIFWNISSSQLYKTYYSEDKGETWKSASIGVHLSSPGYLQDGVLNLVY